MIWLTERGGSMRVADGQQSRTIGTPDLEPRDLRRRCLFAIQDLLNAGASGGGWSDDELDYRRVCADLSKIPS